jgi:hypothetical protein
VKVTVGYEFERMGLKKGKLFTEQVDISTRARM